MKEFRKTRIQTAKTTIGLYTDDLPKPHNGGPDHLFTLMADRYEDSEGNEEYRIRNNAVDTAEKVFVIFETMFAVNAQEGVQPGIIMEAFTDLMIGLPRQPFWAATSALVTPVMYLTMADYLNASAMNNIGEGNYSVFACENEAYYRLVPAIVYAATFDVGEQAKSAGVIRAEIENLACE